MKQVGALFDRVPQLVRDPLEGVPEVSVRARQLVDREVGLALAIASKFAAWRGAPRVVRRAQQPRLTTFVCFAYLLGRAVQREPYRQADRIVAEVSCTSSRQR